MIPKIQENEVIFYYRDSKTCGVALNLTHSFIEEKFYVIDSVGCIEDSESLKPIYNKLVNTLSDIVTVVDSENVTVVTVPNLLRATILVYHEGLTEEEKRELLLGAVGFILIYVKGKFNMVQALQLHKQYHIVCDEDVLNCSEKFQEYYSVNNDDSLVVFGSNVVTAFTIRIDLDLDNLNTYIDREAFQSCIQEMRYTKCDAPLEVRYGDSGYGIRVNLKQIKGELTETIDNKVGQLYNAMLSLIIAINKKE